MFAETVNAPVDHHIAPLVDAINRTGQATTYSSCSGHMRSSGSPFVSFKTNGWDFVGKLRRVITDLNEVTRGQTLLELGPFDSEGLVTAVVRFRMYPWLWAPEINLAPLAAQLVFPPPQLVRLWWAEIAELSRMIAHDAVVGETAIEFFADQQRSRRGYPRWGDSGVVVARPDLGGECTSRLVH